jgi:hypothetical protein
MNTVLIITCVILSAGTGLLFGVVVSSRKYHTKEQRIIELETQLQGSEKILNEIRQQVNNKDEIIEKMRRDLSAVEQSKTSAETKLEEAQKNVEEQKDFLKERRKS